MEFDFDTVLSKRTEADRTKYSYKLFSGGYAIDTQMGDIGVDESRMSVWINFADGGRRDGVGDLTEVGGIKTERHQMNPIILFDHGQGKEKWSSWPIALAEDPETKAYTVELDAINQKGRANAFFYDGKGMNGVDQGEDYEFAKYCEQLYHLIAIKKFIRAGSFGYQVIKAVPLQADYQVGTPQGAHLLSTLLLEVSPVILPANQDTVRKMLCDGKCCGKSLSPYLVKSLSAYAPQRKAQLGYEAKAPENLRQKYHKKSTPVPLAKLSSTKVPPVVWKPGVGALPTKGLSQEAWALLKQQYPCQKRSIYGADCAQQQRNMRTGVYIDPEIGYMCSNCRKVWQVFEDSERHKYKGMSGLRKKYRPTKKLRRRMRKSVSGSSLVYVASKDLERSRRLAEEKGLQFHHMGSRQKGQEKVKLMGSDEGIDHVAKTYGLPMRKSMDVKNMSSAERDKLRKLQDRLLKCPAVQKYIQDHGENKPLWEGGPSASQLRSMLHPNWKADIERYAQEFSGKSIKSLSNSKDKAMPKEILREVKSAPEGMPDTQVDVDIPDTGDAGDAGDEIQGDEEPLSAQILRRMHEDASALMEEYDSWMSPLEHKEVKELLQDTLEELEGKLTNLEDTFSKHHPELKGIESGNEDDKGLEEDNDDNVDDAMEESNEAEEDAEGDDSTDVVEADSGEPEEPTPEEALEGSKKEREVKALPFKVSKGIRQRYSKKGACAECGEEDCDCKKSLRGKRKAIPGNEEHQRKPGRQGTDPAGDTDIGVEEFTGDHGKERTSPASDTDIGVEEDQTKPGHDSESLALQPHHLAGMHEAHSFLGELASSQNFGEEHRMKSYHYHKALSQIPGDLGWLEEEGMEHGMKGAGSDLGVDTGSGSYIPGTGGDPPPSNNNTNTKKPMGTKGMACAKALMSTSDYFARLAHTKDFGDPHRQEAMMHQNELQPFLDEGEQNSEEAQVEEEIMEPGEMGEKSKTKAVNTTITPNPQNLQGNKPHKPSSTPRRYPQDVQDDTERYRGNSQKSLENLKDTFTKQNGVIEDMKKKFEEVLASL